VPGRAQTNCEESKIILTLMTLVDQKKACLPYPNIHFPNSPLGFQIMASLSIFFQVPVSFQRVVSKTSSRDVSTTSPKFFQGEPSGTGLEATNFMSLVLSDISYSVYPRTTILFPALNVRGESLFAVTALLLD